MSLYDRTFAHRIRSLYFLSFTTRNVLLLLSQALLLSQLSRTSELIYGLESHSASSPPLLSALLPCPLHYFFFTLASLGQTLPSAGSLCTTQTTRQSAPTASQSSNSRNSSYRRRQLLKTLHRKSVVAVRDLLRDCHTPSTSRQPRQTSRPTGTTLNLHAPRRPSQRHCAPSPADSTKTKLLTVLHYEMYRNRISECCSKSPAHSNIFVSLT